MEPSEYKHSDLTERIIAAFFKVYNTLGWGFLEKVYHNALEIELKEQGLQASPKAQIKVYYRGVEVGA